MKYIGNAFSFQMLIGKGGNLEWENISQTTFLKETKDAKSCVGNTDIANILGVEYNREPICLKEGDLLYLCQLYGKKLPTGATKLPKDCKFKYFKIKVNNEVYWNGMGRS